MILYLDTSSLVKLYLEEAHSDQVHTWAETAEVLATSRVAYPEALSALARRFREGDLDEETFRAARLALDEQWQSFSVVDLDERAAGNLAVEHGLRGFDAIHLAAALQVKMVSDAPPTSFTSFDVKLNRAAREEGLSVLDPEKGDPGLTRSGAAESPKREKGEQNSESLPAAEAEASSGDE